VDLLHAWLLHYLVKVHLLGDELTDNEETLTVGGEPRPSLSPLVGLSVPRPVNKRLLSPRDSEKQYLNALHDNG